MSEVKFYCKDQQVPLETNAIEMTVKLKVYKNGKMFDAEQTFDLEGIKYAENLFEQCCNGEYPQYTLTEKGKEYFEGLLEDRME